MNVLGGGLATAFVKSIINYSFIDNKSKIRWVEPNINYAFKSNLYLLFLVYPGRFSYITQSYVKQGGATQDYVYKSVNKTTNAAAAGKINFFEVDALSYCAYAYYFKKFRRKVLDAPLLSVFDVGLSYTSNKLRTRMYKNGVSGVDVVSNLHKIQKRIAQAEVSSKDK